MRRAFPLLLLLLAPVCLAEQHHEFLRLRDGKICDHCLVETKNGYIGKITTDTGDYPLHCGEMIGGSPVIPYPMPPFTCESSDADMPSHSMLDDTDSKPSPTAKSPGMLHDLPYDAAGPYAAPRPVHIPKR